MVDLIAYIHHIRGHVITFKTFRLVKAGGKERREYAHIALAAMTTGATPRPYSILIDKAVELLGKWVVATIERGHVTALRRATDKEAKEYRD